MSSWVPVSIYNVFSAFVLVEALLWKAGVFVAAAVVKGVSLLRKGGKRRNGGAAKASV